MEVRGFLVVEGELIGFALTEGGYKMPEESESGEGMIGLNITLKNANQTDVMRTRSGMLWSTDSPAGSFDDEGMIIIHHDLVIFEDDGKGLREEERTMGLNYNNTITFMYMNNKTFSLDFYEQNYADPYYTNNVEVLIAGNYGGSIEHGHWHMTIKDAELIVGEDNNLGKLMYHIGYDDKKMLVMALQTWDSNMEEMFFHAENRLDWQSPTGESSSASLPLSLSMSSLMYWPSVMNWNLSMGTYLLDTQAGMFFMEQDYSLSSDESVSIVDSFVSSAVLSRIALESTGSTVSPSRSLSYESECEYNLIATMHMNYHSHHLSPTQWHWEVVDTKLGYAKKMIGSIEATIAFTDATAHPDDGELRAYVAFFDGHHHAKLLSDQGWMWTTKEGKASILCLFHSFLL